jgi:alkaline phosphatase D
MMEHMLEPDQNPLLSGPLLGEISGDAARIWVQARDEAELSLILYGPDAESGRQYTKAPRAADFHCVVFVLRGLEPEQNYEYALRSRHGETARYPLRAALRDTATRARLAFGSCMNEFWTPELPIFDSIGREQAHAFVMLGDNCYFGDEDHPTEAGMMNAHLRTRRHKSVARLVQKTSTLAIYDDHDFGPNDADGNYEGRERALSTFSRMWAQSQYGIKDAGGIFSAVRLGPIELFLTDGRYHRNVAGETVLGRVQFEWLLDGLRRSKAPVKIIASGTTVLAHHPFYHDWESWHRTNADELEELLSTIEREALHGVIFISGDLHMGQVRRIEGREVGARQGPDFYEVTSSPLGIEPYNEHVLWPEGPLIAQVHDRHNYGVIEVDLGRKDAEVLLLLKDQSGQNLFRQPVPLSSLRVR